MIIGVEIALLCLGLYAVIMGRFPFTKTAKHTVQGWPARVIGVIYLLPIPLSFVVATAVAASFVA
jgi:hypothetical protein